MIDAALIKKMCKVNEQAYTNPIHCMCEKVALLCNDANIEENVVVKAIDTMLHMIEGASNFDATNDKDGQQRTLLGIAESHGSSLLFDAIQYRILFHGRYKITKAYAHKSATCIVSLAEMYEGAEATNVTLKFMVKADLFEHELRVREERELDSQFFTSLLQSHNSRTADEDGLLFATAIDKFREGVYKKYPYCIVLPCATQDLHEVITHDHIAGIADQILQVKDISHQIALALSHLHGQRIIHCNLKPLNVILSSAHNKTTWKLTDLSAATEIGEPVAGSSSCYAPPELLICTDDGATKVLNACESYDIWSFGALLYLLITGRELFHCDQEDKLGEDELLKLQNWDELRLREVLRRIKGGEHHLLVIDLLGELLQPDPMRRPATMSLVLEHPFFADESIDLSAEASIIIKRVEQMHEQGLTTHQDMKEEQERQREVLTFVNERNWTLKKLGAFEAAEEAERSGGSLSNRNRELQQLVVGGTYK
jgi:serine/threonine protein kinase